MNLIEISLIKIPERQRKEMKKLDLELLWNSIQDVGLIHALVLRETSEGFELVAGERRLTAIRENNKAYRYNDELIQPGFVPYITVNLLSAAERFQVELEENLRRVDLSWQEKAKALADLHSLRSREAEARGDIQTFSDTGKEVAALRGTEPLGDSNNEVSRSVLVSQHLSNPKVAQAASLKKAANVIAEEFEAIVRQDMNALVGNQTQHIIINGSCLVILPAMNDTFDCILTDPPYGMGADQFGDVGPQHHYTDDHETAHNIALTILMEGFRLTKPQAHLYMFCDLEQFLGLRELARTYGWRPFRTPIIWNKTDSKGHDPWPNKGFRRSYECILYCDKGGKAYYEFEKDVIDCPGISSPIHPAAKPTELYRRLLARSCMPGDRVLDPCCGTGPIFEAANRLNLTAVGIELDETYYNLASSKRFPEQPK